MRSAGARSSPTSFLGDGVEARRPLPRAIPAAPAARSGYTGCRYPPAGARPPGRGHDRCAAMVGAMVDDMEEDLLARHAAVAAIGEAEAQPFAATLQRQLGDIAGEPGGRILQPATQDVVARHHLAVGLLVGRRLAQQARPEQFLDDRHVIELLQGEGQRGRERLGVDPGDGIEGAAVGPGLVVEGLDQQVDLQGGSGHVAGFRVHSLREPDHSPETALSARPATLPGVHRRGRAGGRGGCARRCPARAAPRAPAPGQRWAGSRPARQAGDARARRSPAAAG